MKTRHGTPGRGTLMRTTLIAAILIAASGLGPRAVVAQSKKIDLQTREGVAAVKGEWRYHDVKIVEVEGKGPDGKPNKTYNYEPRAFTADFDDTKWEVVAPETLKDPRVFFQTTADDYGEIWVDGTLPRTPGKGGEAVVAGFNTANRVELKDPQPGKVYQIAVFAINGPISATPSNWLFLKNTSLDLVDKPAK
jgi:hypothetical protein